MTKMMEGTCDDSNHDAGYPILIKQAYNPNFVLGQDVIALQIDQKELDSEDQKVDLALFYQPCHKTWSVHSKKYPTVYTEENLYHMLSDETTCELINPIQWKPNMTEGEEQDLARSNRTVDEILQSR